MQVVIAVKKNILNKIMIAKKTDLISHLYSIVLDIKELLMSGKYSKKTKVVNFYNNKIKNRFV